jgi:hypothetical protein
MFLASEEVFEVCIKAKGFVGLPGFGAGAGVRVEGSLLHLDVHALLG